MTDKKGRDWLWAVIAVFLFFWLGDQLLKALFTAEIMGLRTSSLISFDQEPVWFVFIVLLKSAFFIGSTIFIYFQFIRKRYKW